ncbi:hypothetical protein BDV98DRAFT_302714 [Pterulicium gracile]|uniref:MYND-type domain-containing protein n=1 Tax=Pterulicium gracile TaxID=1884261 RepID=A0A5C3Q414_9AGAR|nr:hypothetical protein BDV98DRAFT_302714 [Pterula gracilis]
MRESNFAFPSQNRACVCITSQLYDRRALDTTSPLPLFNSLTHLTYLTSTSPRIREIMTMDGGLERLVRILQDFCICPPPPENASLVYGLSPPSLRPPRLPPTLNPPSYDKHAAYRFSLAFQCVVNIGVRGSEPIRSRVVQAGTLQVVGCILEAWLANKGFAVGPSSSATGLPRESREQRHARRVAMQEMRQREEAMELDRALQRSIHLSQGHGGGQGRGLLLPASTSASTPSEDADGDADEESATDNSTAATPQGAHTPTTTASSSFPHTHAHPQPARDRSGTIIATTRRARPPLTHRPSSPSDSSRPETETEREEEEGTDVDMAGPSRGGTIRRPRRASANPHQHIIITDASDAPTIVGAIDTINITVDMDPIDPDDFGAGVMGARNDDFAMGAPPGAPGALERLVGVGGRRGESVSPSPSPGPGSVGPSSPSVGSAEGQPGAMDVDVDVEEVVSVDAEAEAGDADEETEMDGDDDEEMEVEVEGTPRRARRSRMSSGHSLSSTSGSGSGRHHGRRHAPDATPRAGSSGLPSVLERSGHSDSGVSSSGQSTSTSGYSGASTSGQSSASTSVSTASTSGHSTSTFGHSNGSTSAAAISVHGRTPTVPSATPRIVTATTTTTPTAVPRRTHLTHAHLHAVHTHPHAAHPHPHPAHPHHAHHHAHAHAPTDPTPGPYRDEDVLLSLQLLAYLSKYPHVRQAFYEPCRTFHPASRGTFYEVGKGESKEGKGKDASSSKVKGKDAAAASSGKGSEKEKDKGEEKEKGKANLAASTSAAPREGLSGFLRAFGSPSRGSGSSSRMIGSGRPVLRGTGAASPARGSAQSSRGSPTNGTGSGTGPFGALTIPPYGGGSRRGQEKETQSHSGGKDSSKSSSSSASSTQAQASSSTKGDSPSSKPDSSSASSASQKASKDKEKDEPTLLPRQTNVFSLVERFTFRPSSSEADLPNPPPKLPVEIQYWAGVIMRNACRKDDSRGGIRQCANMLCGKWESYPREFAKCRRCRKAKYCGKECQSTAWGCRETGR